MAKEIKEDIENRELKTAFLEWLSSSISYRHLQETAEFIDTYDVMTRVERMRANPELYTTQRLIEQLYTISVDKDRAPEVFARIKVLKERFGIN